MYYYQCFFSRTNSTVRCWCLAFQTLTLISNLPSDNNEQTLDNTLQRMAKVIILDQNFSKLLLAFFTSSQIKGCVSRPYFKNIMIINKLVVHWLFLPYLKQINVLNLVSLKSLVLDVGSIFMLSRKTWMRSSTVCCNIWSVWTWLKL